MSVLKVRLKALPGVFTAPLALMFNVFENAAKPKDNATTETNKAATTTYFAPKADPADPASEGLFEFAAGAPVADPAAEGFYEADGVNFVASTDTTIDAGKTYYAKSASADPTPVSGKTYYEEITEVTYKLTQDRLPEAAHAGKPPRI